MIVFSGAKVKATDSDGNTQPIGLIGPSQDTLKAADMETRSLLTSIVKELKIMNLHLSIMTDNVITREDVEV